jgi:hypothetical protein
LRGRVFLSFLLRLLLLSCRAMETEGKEEEGEAAAAVGTEGGAG